MGKVRKSQYRQPVTANGLKKMERGTLDWFDDEMFANFNTGTLEQYMDEKNRSESFQASPWDWRKILFGIALGTFFTLVNMYVGLKVGAVVAGSMYIIYLLGMIFEWRPSEINLTSTASNGAAMICTGFVFTFPAIYLLKESELYPPMIQDLPENFAVMALIASLFSGLLGIMFFIIFRRIWLVEDPLPLPSFEANIKLMDLARRSSAEDVGQARSAMKLATFWISGTAFFTFLRDFPLISSANGRTSILDSIFGGRYYEAGDIREPLEGATYTHLAFGLIPIQFGLGWFMKFRTALLMCIGTFLAWFVIIPLAVYQEVGYYVYLKQGDTIVEGYMNVADVTPDLGLPAGYPAFAAYEIAKLMGIGVILGGGFTAIIKMLPVFKTVTRDMRRAKGGTGGEKGEWVPGKGWYEWPASHILIVAVLTFFGVAIVFWVGGFNGLESWMFSALLVTTTFFLGAIAVKTFGETGTEPVSACSFIVLLFIMALFLALGTDRSQILVMGLLGTTVFASAISMSGDVIWDFKAGLYCGNRPSQLIRALTIGLIPGAIVSVFVAILLSKGLASGALDLPAPQANVFAKFALIIIGGNVAWSILILGVVIGVFVELLVGMGTAFGLGMYLPLPIQLPLLLGGASRDFWEKRYLDPRAKAEGWTERQRTIKLLRTYLMATGLIIGEAIVGALIAIYVVLL